MKYSNKVLQYFKKPKNFGKIQNYDGLGKIGNIVCGDVIWFYIKVGKNKKKEDIIKDIKFETYGCVSAISSSSIVTEMVINKTITEAIKISKNDIIKALDGLPQIKVHCAILSVDALHEAIYDYLKKSKKPIPKQLLDKHNKIIKTSKKNDISKK